MRERAAIADLVGTAGDVSSTVSGATTTFDLAHTGVSPGSCTNCNLTVDAFGRVTSQANGSAGGGSVSTSSAISVNNFPFWTSAGGALFPLRQALDRVDTQLDLLIYDAFPLPKAS